MALTRRIAELEKATRGTPAERQQIRVAMERIAARDGKELPPPAVVESIITKFVGIRPHIQAMYASGLTSDEVRARLGAEHNITW